MLKDLCFEVIQTCPNKCKFCSSNSSQDKTTIIALEQFKRTVMHFIEQGGIEEISISGGEPFLHPDLFEMIKFSKEKGIRTVLFTSGIKRASKMSEKMLEYIKKKCESCLKEIEECEPWNEKLKRNVITYYNKLVNSDMFASITREECEKLKMLGLDKIVFDWQAVDTEIDNELMGRKGLNTCLMDSLIRARMVGLNVDVHFIPMKQNYRQFPDIIECLEIANIKNISILNFVPQGRGNEYKEELMLNQEELKQFSEILKKEKENFSGNIRIGIPLNGKISHMCTAGTEKLDIKYDGTILPCPAFKEMNVETMQKYGIKLYSIYEDLEKVIVHSGKRKIPLCKQVYGFNGDLTSEKDILR
ncbi:MAG: radical SAM protein [Clostridiales bacterium]|nr:radical SAM protein [Clostridiales bacterium]